MKTKEEELKAEIKEEIKELMKYCKYNQEAKDRLFRITIKFERLFDDRK